MRAKKEMPDGQEIRAEGPDGQESGTERPDGQEIRTEDPDGQKLGTDNSENGLEELSIEEIFGRLDEIIGRLEDSSISLEDSFSCYEAGMKLVKACSGKIDKVEKRIQVLHGQQSEEEWE